MSFPGWARNYDEAMRRARSGGKLVLIDFYTDWCGYCKKLDREVFPDPRVVKALAQVVPVQINAEREGLTLARKFGVTSFPTLIFLDGSGAEAARIGGYMPADPFLERVNAVVHRQRALPGLQARVRTNPADTKAALDLLEVYASQNKVAPSEALLAQIQRADPKNATGRLAAALNIVAGMNIQSMAVSKARQKLTRCLAVARTPKDRGYAALNLGVCDAADGHLDAAIARWRNVKTLPGLPPDMHATADRFIQRAESMKSASRR